MKGTVGAPDVGVFLWLERDTFKRSFKIPHKTLLGMHRHFVRLVPGGQIEKKIDPNNDEWCSLGHCRNSYPFNRKQDDWKTTFQPGDLIVVDYDVPAFPESLRLGVWWGVAADSITVQ